MTREELVELREKALNGLVAPSDVRGADGSGVSFSNATDRLKLLARLDSEIDALDAATGGGNSGSIVRLYGQSGL